MIITDNEVEQRSLDWHRMRLGCFTGSTIENLMGEGRKKGDIFSVTAKTLCYKVAAERTMIQQWVDDDEVFSEFLNMTSVTTRAMQFGIDMEDSAKDHISKVLLPEWGGEWEMIGVSSCKHDTIPHFSASPDALLKSKDGRMLVVEIKCPSISTHMKYSSSIFDAETLKQTESKYYWQVMAEVACTGAKGGIFVSYMPYLQNPFHYAYIEPNELDIERMENKVSIANAIIDRMIDSVSNKKQIDIWNLQEQY